MLLVCVWGLCESVDEAVGLLCCLWASAAPSAGHTGRRAAHYHGNRCVKAWAHESTVWGTVLTRTLQRDAPVCEWSLKIHAGVFSVWAIQCFTDNSISPHGK